MFSRHGEGEGIFNSKSFVEGIDSSQESIKSIEIIERFCYGFHIIASSEVGTSSPFLEFIRAKVFNSRTGAKNFSDAQ